MRSVPIAALGRAFAIAACLAAAACSAGAGSPQPTMTSGPNAVPSDAASVSPTDPAAPLATATPTVPASPATLASPTTPAPSTTNLPATPAPSPTERTYPSPRATSIKPGDVVETLVADIRVRSEPRIADTSHKFEPLLPSGTKLYVLDGPATGSGYAWFRVVPMSSTGLPWGWVAVAGRDGEAWLGPSNYDCPAVPDDFASLIALPPGAGTACFSRVPITIRARLFACNCDVDPGPEWIEPNWLWAIGQGPFIVGPSEVRLTPADGAYGGHYRGLELVLDPKGRFPAKLPIGTYLEDDEWTVPHVVRITGMFDHPAAQTCRVVSNDDSGEVAPPHESVVGTCRLEFAVTRIVIP